MSKNPAIKELEVVENDLLSKLKDVRGTLAILRSMYSNGSDEEGDVTTIEHGNDKYDDFDKRATFREKLTFVFRAENRFLHVREIAEILNRLEPRYNVKDIIAKLPGAITWFKKQGTLVKYQVDSSNLNVFWGSKNWIGADNKPKEQHMYDASKVNNSRKTEEIEI